MTPGQTLSYQNSCRASSLWRRDSHRVPRTAILRRLRAQRRRYGCRVGPGAKFHNLVTDGSRFRASWCIIFTFPSIYPSGTCDNPFK